MKVVLDMNRKFRRPSSESSKLKKGYRPNVYAEPNATTVIDSSGKTNLKNIMEQGKSGLKNGIKSSVPSQSRDETKTETKPKSNMTPNKQAISEIRKLYFQSLEKSSEEDLLEYFHRIYPELEHLVGKKSKDYNSSDPSSVSDRVQEVLWASEPKSQPQPQPQPYPQTTHREKDSPSLPDQEETIQDGNVDPETLENHSESDYFKQFDDVKPSDPSNTTDISPPEKKGFMDQITSLYESYKPANFFHNPFHHVMVSEAASSAEICPSIVGAVIFGLFLILL
ncbi:hypothetical protein JCM33374_g1749 [Metschnikowia sp. JCM 33374]|nr:hypothetical protein JCM33374_g1749 [Metschnikowia sp. JCM 33374]